MSKFPVPPAPGKFMVAAGLRLHYLEAGKKTAPPFLLIHGFGGCCRNWLRLIPDLEKNFRVLVPDLPGFGYSERNEDYSMSLSDQADTVIAFLDAMKIKSCHLMGHSMGGGISMLLAARHPDRFQKMVLLCPLSYPFKVDLRMKLGMSKLAGPFVVGHLYTRRMFMNYIRTNVFFDFSRADQNEIEIEYALFDSPASRRAFQKGLVATHGSIDWLANEIRKITLPTLILWGDHDLVLPPEFAPRLQQDIPGAQLHILKDCGHMIQVEMTDEVCRMVREFLQMGT
jgi:pimeloyl-ACP methyl ester carboxylesterase